jgi:hypothetical protein
MGVSEAMTSNDARDLLGGIDIGIAVVALVVAAVSATIWVNE